MFYLFKDELLKSYFHRKKRKKIFMSKPEWVCVLFPGAYNASHNAGILMLERSKAVVPSQSAALFPWLQESAAIHLNLQRLLNLPIMECCTRQTACFQLAKARY